MFKTISVAFVALVGLSGVAFAGGNRNGTFTNTNTGNGVLLGSLGHAQVSGYGQSSAVAVGGQVGQTTTQRNPAHGAGVTTGTTVFGGLAVSQSTSGIQASSRGNGVAGGVVGSTGNASVVNVTPRNR